MCSSINVSEDAEEVRVIGCGVADAEGVYPNGKMVRMSEVGILAFGKSEAMKRRSPMGEKVQTSRKRSRFVCERTAGVAKELAREGVVAGIWPSPLTTTTWRWTIATASEPCFIIFLLERYYTRDVQWREVEENTFG